MALNHKTSDSALEIDRLATQLAKDPHSKAFMPLAEEYGKVGMWQEAAGVLEDGLKFYPGFITAMVALGRAYDQMGQVTKAKAILEESIKLSPENLRAHRTLIKIYTIQGLNESALQSCDVILRINPRDEEALSAQSALSGASQRTGMSEQFAASISVPRMLSVKNATEPPVSVEFPVCETASSVASGSIPVEEQRDTTDALLVAQELVETALHRNDQPAEQLAVPEPDTQPPDTVALPTPSPHAGVVAQLEVWLRTIDTRRRDRAASNESHTKTS